MKSRPQPRSSRPYKEPTLPTLTYPARINKYLAHKGLATRRGADELITKGAVIINGRVAVLGDKVMEGDVVEVQRLKTQVASHERVYVAYNKPRGINTTHHLAPGSEGADDINAQTLDSIEFKGQRLVPMGRLDKNTSGLMIFSNDGRITDRLLNPAYAHEKEFLVTVNKTFSPSFIKLMSQGIKLSDGITKPAHVERVDDTTFTITLTESRNHQIQRMCAELGFDVVSSTRTRILSITLDGIPEGDYREITGTDLSRFLKTLGLAA